MPNMTENKTTRSDDKIRKALLVIDVQENLLKPRSRIHMDPAKVTDLLSRVNKSIASFNDQGELVIYTINEWTNPLLNFLTGNVCKKGEKGTRIDLQVTVVNNNIFHKSGNSAFTSNALATFLKKESINVLYVTGLLGEACIRSTVTDAINQHYSVVVIEDAVGSKNEKLKLRSIEHLRRKGAVIIKSDHL